MYGGIIPKSASNDVLFIVFFSSVEIFFLITLPYKTFWK